MAEKRYNKRHVWDAVRWIKCHPEDIPLARENLAARDRGYDNDGLRQLMAAISLRAVTDYSLATKGIHVDHTFPPITIEECERFFESDIFDFFINRINKDEVKKHIRGMNPEMIRAIWKDR